MATDLVFLKDEKLHTLADLIYRQEVLNIQSLVFGSEAERVAYLNDCRSNYLTSTSLLNTTAELKTKLQNDNVRSPIAVNVYTYTESCINNALQIFQNYTVRKDYLEKINDHVQLLITSLQELDTQNPAAVADLDKEVEEYNKAILAYSVKYRSPASREFSRMLRAQNIEFEDLVKTYQARLNYTSPFKDLQDIQKLEVYDEIMEVSGRGRALDDTIKNLKDKAGKAVLLFNAGMIAWDIYTADHVLLEVTKNAIVEAAKIGGAKLGTIIGAAISTKLTGVQASAIFITMVGTLSSIAGAFIVGAAAGGLVDRL
ncbi:hypothetical protein FNV43_RR10128 [Rhamnella rubrinervis]|uniref:Uncharacterized protein n=1 Tax=Rhamnella rubrinervis TaxID=2594499 RepID=A0A8K0HCJ8_9ROSA|nr:hypothetical protein FNV43_RR10128 [Rhamnella rubrinervis]